jgi:type IV secretory pathway component VirB8
VVGVWKDGNSINGKRGSRKKTDLIFYRLCFPCQEEIQREQKRINILYKFMSEHLQKFSLQKNPVNFSVIIIPFDKQRK